MIEKHIKLFSIAAFFAANAPLALAAQPVPEKFWGLWGSVSDCKLWYKKPNMRMGAPEGGAEISKEEISFAASSCHIKKIHENTNELLKADIACIGDGDEWTRALTIKVINENKIQIDRAAPIGRCVAPKK